MSRKIYIIGLVVYGLIAFCSGYQTAAHFAQVRELERAQALQPGSQTILLALKGQGFLITQTYVFNQSVTIDHANGSFLNDVFWNQIILATANIKVSSGVDLRKLEQNDIAQSGHTYTVALPALERFSTELLGAVQVHNKQGILKQIFENDNGYNQAISALKLASEKATQTPELIAEAQRGTVQELERLIKLVDHDATVTVVFR